jgi:hypothetical protein
MYCKRALCLHRCSEGVRGAGEDNEEGVALCLDLMAVGGADSFTDQPVMIGQESSVRLRSECRQETR